MSGRGEREEPLCVCVCDGREGRTLCVCVCVVGEREEPCVCVWWERGGKLFE